MLDYHRVKTTSTKLLKKHKFDTKVIKVPLMCFQRGKHTKLVIPTCKILMPVLVNICVGTHLILPAPVEANLRQFTVILR